MKSSVLRSTIAAFSWYPSFCDFHFPKFVTFYSLLCYLRVYILEKFREKSSISLVVSVRMYLKFDTAAAKCTAVSEQAMKVQPLYRLSYPTIVILCSYLPIRATRITTNNSVNRQVCAYIAHYLSDRNCCDANTGAGNKTQEYSIEQ